MRTLVAVWIGAALAMPGVAWAQLDAADVHHAPFTLPDLANGNGAGVDVFIARFEESVELTAFTVEPNVVAKARDNVFVWGTFPLAFAVGEGDSLAGWGNLTGGAYIVERRDAVWFGGGASISLPTAADGGDEALAVLVGGFINLDDTGRYLSDITTLRVHGDVRGEVGNLFAQGQVRVDRLSEDGTVHVLFLGLSGGIGIGDSTAAVLDVDIMSDALDDDAVVLSGEAYHLGVRTGGGNITVAVRLSYVSLPGFLFGDAAYGVGLESRTFF